MSTIRTIRKSIEKPRRLPPIIIVPDKTYIDDTGEVIPTDVMLISDPLIYARMRSFLGIEV